MIVDIDPQARKRATRSMTMAALGSMAIGLLIPVATWVAFHDAAPSVRMLMAVAYIGLMALAHWTRLRHAATLAAELDAVITQVRIKIADRIQRSELLVIESLAAEDDTTRDVEFLSRMTAIVVDGTRLVFNFATRVFYILSLSGAGFLVGCAAALGIVLLARPGLATTREASADGERAAKLLETGISRICEGFAQIRCDPATRQGIQEELRDASAARADARQRMDDSARSLQVGSYVMLLLALGVVLFAGPITRTLSVASKGQLISLMFFIIPSILFALRELPMFPRARTAWNNIGALATQLGDRPERAVLQRTEFSHLQLRDVTFDYPERSFVLGPIDMTIRAGELVFVVGGNGSGKTTLFKVLTGLYPHSDGQIYLDGQPVETHSERAEVHSLCSAVFADHHLFERLYGLDVEPERVEALLEQLGLRGVVRVDGGQFERLELSSGQSKRLALVVALLEDRPLLVLDEWAAHQDPETRRWFYKELLPQLRASGRTIIAVTHDERYFDVADRIIRLSDGQIESIAPATTTR